MKKTAATKALWGALCVSLPPVPALHVSEWAESHRVLSRESCAEPGRYSGARVPYQRAAMDDVNEPAVSEAIYCWAAQTGKSELINNITGFFVHADPAPILLVQPTVELAEAYSKERIAPMIRDTPALKALVRDPRSRDSGNTLLSKVFPGGNMALIGANAPSGLAGRPRRVILLDEIDRFPSSAGSEGDPCSLADKRAESFYNAVKVKTSTPTVKGRSKIWALLEQSDYQKLHCRCPHCSFEQVLIWAQVGWPEGKPEDAYIECANPECRVHLTDAERIGMIRTAEWKATQPFHGIRGRWLNGINTLFRHHKGYRNRLHQFAAEFLKAKQGGAQTMRVWVNTFLAECFEEESESIAPIAITERAEDYSPDSIPEDVLILTAGADVQKDRIECEVKGFGRDEESWGIEKKVFDGDPEQDEVWQNLDAYLLTAFAREDGVPLKIERCFIDMQFKSQRVLAFCGPRLGRGVYPCRGLNRVGVNLPPLLPARPSRNNRARIAHWNVGVTIAKTALYDRLQLAPPGPRSMHFPNGYGYDDDYFRQLTSEKRRTRYSYGQPYTIFEKPHAGVRNEALDINVYALAALHSRLPIAWQRLAENLKTLAPQQEQGPSTEVTSSPHQSQPSSPTKPAPSLKALRPMRKNFATSW